MKKLMKLVIQKFYFKNSIKELHKTKKIQKIKNQK